MQTIEGLIQATETGVTTEPLLSLREVSRLLGVQERTIYGWVREGKIPSVKVGHYLKFEPSEIRRWIADRRRKETKRKR